MASVLPDRDASPSDELERKATTGGFWWRGRERSRAVDVIDRDQVKGRIARTLQDLNSCKPAVGRDGKAHDNHTVPAPAFFFVDRTFFSTAFA